MGQMAPMLFKSRQESRVRGKRKSLLDSFNFIPVMPVAGEPGNIVRKVS